MVSYNRRDFLRTVSAGMAAAAITPQSLWTVVKRTGKSKSPNIVFVIADDQRADMMSCAGNRYIKTPNFDKMAADGLRLTNAFVNSAVCSPSRGSFLTGKHPHMCGTPTIIHMSHTFHQSQLPFPARLHDAGYNTAHFGKWHLGEGNVPKPGYDHWVGFYAVMHYFDPVLTINGSQKGFKGYTDDVLTDMACEHIKKLAKEEKPFCVYVALTAPHYNFSYPPRLEHALDDIEFELPPSVNEDFDKSGKPPVIRNSPLRNDKLGNLKTFGSLDNMIRRYYRSSLSLDGSFGKIMDALEQAGVADDTILIYTSDHGHMLGEHGLGAKHVAYEESIRIPMLVRYPKMIKPGTVRDDMVMNMDIAPTLLDLAGVEIPADVTGMSLRKLFEAGDKPVNNWREDCLYFLEGIHLAVWTRRYKLITYPNRPDRELYDLAKDPYEINNLAGNLQYADVLKDMQKRLDRQVRQNELRDRIDATLQSVYMLGPFKAEDKDEIIQKVAASPLSNPQKFTVCGREYGWRKVTIKDGSNNFDLEKIFGGDAKGTFLLGFEIERYTDYDPFVRVFVSPAEKPLAGYANGKHLYQRGHGGNYNIFNTHFNTPLNKGINTIIMVGEIKDYPSLSARLITWQGKTSIPE